MTIIRGIDVSQYQGLIDWAAVSGYDFAVSRMTIGRTTRDTTGRANLNGFSKSGLVAGAYGVVGTAEPVEDGAKLLVKEIRAAGADPSKILVMLDAEDFGNGTHPTIDQVDRYARQLHALIGRWPVAYVPGWWLNMHHYSVAGLALANCPWAPSHYLPSPWDETKLQANKPPSLKGFHSLAWLQYTSSAKVSGIAGNVDANVFYGSLGLLQAQLLQEDDVTEAEMDAVADKVADKMHGLLYRIALVLMRGSANQGFDTKSAPDLFKAPSVSMAALSAQLSPVLDDEAKFAAFAQQMLSALQADPAERIDEQALGQRMAEILHTLGLPVTIADADLQRNIAAVLNQAHIEVQTTSS